MSEPDQKARPTYTADYVKGDWDLSVFLGNPHVDNLTDALIRMGAEFWAMRQRMMALEKLLEDKGVVVRTALESFRFEGPEKAMSDAERDGYVSRVFSVLSRETAPVEGAVPTTRVKPRDFG
jgi:hypothetical protein